MFRGRRLLGRCRQSLKPRARATKAAVLKRWRASSPQPPYPLRMGQRGIFGVLRACKRSCPDMPEACLRMSRPCCGCWWREGGWLQAAQAGPAQDPAAKTHSGPKIGGRGHGTAHAVEARGLVSFQELGLARRCSALLLAGLWAAGNPCVLQNQGPTQGANRLKRLCWLPLSFPLSDAFHTVRSVLFHNRVF